VDCGSEHRGQIDSWITNGESSVACLRLSPTEKTEGRGKKGGRTGGGGWYVAATTHPDSGFKPTYIDVYSVAAGHDIGGAEAKGCGDMLDMYICTAE
jgi:hypothetical protein